MLPLIFCARLTTLTLFVLFSLVSSSHVSASIAHTDTNSSTYNGASDYSNEKTTTSWTNYAAPGIFITTAAVMMALLYYKYNPTTSKSKATADNIGNKGPSTLSS